MQKTVNISGTQRAEILEKLRSGKKIPAYDLAAIALQYSARIFELRKAGYEIRNETKRVGNQIHSTFELVSEPEPFKLSGSPDQQHRSSVSKDTDEGTLQTNWSEPLGASQPTFVSSAVAPSFLDYEMGRRSR